MADNILDIAKLSIEKKQQITVLNLHGLGLTEFPKEIFELKKLRNLYISRNKIEIIPDEISLLTNLRYLNLSYNQISQIPESFNKLKLQHLFLNNNKLTEFPILLSKMKQIESLSLSSNNIEKLPEYIEGFNYLKNLYLENLQIKRLPKTFVFLPQLNSIELQGNTLENVPLEIANQGINSLRNYFHSLDESEESYKVFEAKLLIVGEGNVGKTCLMEKLMNNKYVNKLNSSTEGIDIKSWFVDTKKYKDFRINIWDFGGQEIYHATHQFFLTKRSLYILVWSARTDDNIISFDYWLNVIKLLSDNAPVLIVLNKIDERIKMIDEESISSKFKNIVSFHKVSALKGTGMKELSEIIKNEIENLPHIGDVLPKAWIDVRTELENIGENYISIQEYKKICRIYGLNEKQAIFLSHYFHDLGVILHFQDNDILKDILFLRPEWATNAVYKVTDTKSVQANYGELDYSTLSKIWSMYDENKYKYLIELMKKFELCFKVANNKYIVPELLSEKKPLDVNGWDYNDNLTFEYHYDFMPTGIITRLIVRIHDMVLDSNFWKNGLIIRNTENFKDFKGQTSNSEDTYALIISFPLERKIKINIRGYEKQQLLAIVRREIGYIHKTLNYPNCREMVPCKCNICKNAIDKNSYNYSDLKIYLDNGESSIFCIKGKNRVEIKSLLDTVEIKDGNKIDQINIDKCENVILTDNFNHYKERKR